MTNRVRLKSRRVPSPLFSILNVLDLQHQVVMGGGRRHFFANGTKDSVYPEDADKIAKRIDKRDLVAEWKKQRSGENKKFEYVTTRQELAAVDPKKTDSLFGEFGSW